MPDSSKSSANRPLPYAPHDPQARRSPVEAPIRNPIQQRNAPRVPADTNSKAYKQAARRWTSTMVALPILIVTSYYLFDRLALGNEQKTWQVAPEAKAKNGE
ncbi:hypothetical protein GGR57DRAFT_519478 [Xylariaceae sp. FL1272]|nr:hypothetical protein GGR57DRAFT_519478 [Xylariaceae sp. FL1272]